MRSVARIDLVQTPNEGNEANLNNNSNSRDME